MLYNTQRSRDDMGNNLECHWTKMVEMKKQARETLAQITTVVEEEQIDESDCVHPRITVTIHDLVEQSDVRVRYYTEICLVPESAKQDG